MSVIKRKKLKFDDGRTKQAYLEDTDINKILRRAQKTGTVTHIAKHQPMYGHFEDYNFFEHQNKLEEANMIFADLPGELRREFSNSPALFFEYVNDPQNKDRLPELLPALAEPGRQFLDVSPRTPPDDRPEPQERPPQPRSGDEPPTPAPPQGDDS